MRLQILCGVATILAISSGCKRDSDPTERPLTHEQATQRPLTHEQAIERFSTFAEGGLRAKGKETRSLFYGCFRKGDAAAKYERALSSAKKEVVTNEGDAQKTVYKWKWTGVRSPNNESLDEHAFLIVVVGGYNNTILDVYDEYHPYDHSWSN
jgi:hypothetical protein